MMDLARRELVQLIRTNALAVAEAPATGLVIPIALVNADPSVCTLLQESSDLQS